MTARRADVTVERVIEASPEQLYDLVSDLPRMGEWSPESEGGAWRGGATKAVVGAKFRGHNRIGWRRWATTCTVTEARPGVYVFGDAQQWELGAMPPESLALTCRATVVSHAGGRTTLDSGSKALGADRAAYATGWGRLLDHPEARIVQLSEHHAVVDLAGEPLPPVGSQVDVVPNHCCAAVNLADGLWVEEYGGLRRWPVAARGRNG